MMTEAQRVKLMKTEDDLAAQVRLEDRFESIATTASGFAIVDQDTHGQATELLKALKGLRKEIVSYWQPMKSQAHDLWKLIRAREKTMLDLADESSNQINGRLDAFEDDLRAQAEAARRKDEERALEAAAVLEDAGLDAEAEAQLDSVPETVEPEIPKVEGVHFRTSPDFEVLDILKIHREYLMPNLPVIRKVVTAHGFGATKIVGEGIRVYEKKTRVVRT
jgi:hypothetical protein